MLSPQKDAFHIPPEISYFNCAYMAPRLKSVHRAGQAAMERLAQPWQLGASDFFDDAERARGLFAQLIGATPEHVAIVPSASYGVATAANNLRIERGQSVLLTEAQFPSNVYSWRALAERTGANVRTVARPADGDWTRAVLAALDSSVAIAALPNCHWTDGSYLDLETISAALQDIDARLVLDVTQSLGAMPLDVGRVKVDFLACAAYKWLLGPYSLGFLYVADEHHGGEPLEHNWITRERSEDFASLVEYRDGYQPGARRYDMGERANFIALPMACTALEQVLAWTPEAIADSLSGISQEIAAAAQRLGLSVAATELRAPHLLGVSFPGGCPPTLISELKGRGVQVSVRGDAVRIAPHLCVDQTDVARLVDALAATAG